MKSSAKPSSAQPSATPKTARLAVSRSESTRYGTAIARKRIRPPIVGVPAFAWCSCGPSSRICWPNSLTRRNWMNFGPRKIVISIAAMPAIRTSPRSIWFDAISPMRHRARSSSARTASVNASSPTAREPFTRTASPLAEQPADDPTPSTGVGRPLVRGVVAGELADADDRVDAEIARVGAGLAVVGGAVGAELAHPAEDGDPAAAQRARAARLSSAARIEIGLAL